MKKNELIDAILTEMDRVWGVDGFDGTAEQYHWLQENYEISEEDDVRWQLLIEHDANELSDEDQEDEELMAFLRNNKAVRGFLHRLLTNYNSSSVVYSKSATIDSGKEEGLSKHQVYHPSQITDIYWVRAERKKGNYPSHSGNGGKWLIFVPIETLDEVWEKIRTATESGILGGSAKAATAKPNDNAANPRQKVICVYTYDWTDIEDVMRVRNNLRELGVTWKIPYKSDNDTYSGKYVNRGSKGISKYYE